MKPPNKEDDRLLKDILEDPRRQVLPIDEKVARVKEEFINVPRFKMVRDGSLSIPAKQIDAPQISVSLIRNEIDVQHNHLGDGIEIMVLILLNIDNYPILTRTVAVGTTNHVIVDPADVFSLVLSKEFMARGFVLGHNHPSGNILMSDEDKFQCNEFIDLGRRFGRPMRDFIIVGDGTEKYYSHRNSHYGF